MSKTKSGTPEPPALYRVDLLQKAKDAAGNDASFRNLAIATGLASATLQEIFAGRGSKLEPLFILAKHFGVDWVELFDTKKTIEKQRAKLSQFVTVPGYENGRKRSTPPIADQLADNPAAQANAKTWDQIPSIKKARAKRPAAK
jgi:hypothetical protein